MTHSHSAGTTHDPAATSDPRPPVVPERGPAEERGSIRGPGLPADDVPREPRGELEPDAAPGAEDPDVLEELDHDDVAAAVADRPVVDVERE